MIKYQLVGEIEDKERLFPLLPFLDFEKSIGEVEKDTKKIKESDSLQQAWKVSLKKGINKIYSSVEDKIQRKKLRKLDIIKIK